MTTVPEGSAGVAAADPGVTPELPARSRVRPGRGPVADRLGLFAARLALGVALVGIWQAVVTFELADPTVTSSPSDVGKYLWGAISGSVLWSNLASTMWAVAIAFLLASAVGIVVGIALALLPRVERVVAPYLDALNAMPRIALAPVFVVAFGLTPDAKIALAFSIVVFIVLTSARAGVRSVDVDIMRLATMLGANRRQMFVKVLFPVAIPSIFGGLRLGVIFSLLGVVTSELIAARDGVGQLLQGYASVFQIDGVYGLLIVLAVIASLLNSGMSALERHLLRWQAPGSGGR